MFVTLRVAVVVIGFAVIIGAELLDNKNNAKPFATGARRSATFYDDAAVFSLRILGAGLIFAGLISFVIANHLPAR